MHYTFIMQHHGLFVTADCFDGTVWLRDGLTMVGKIDSKGMLTEMRIGTLVDKKFDVEDHVYCLSQ